LYYSKKLKGKMLNLDVCKESKLDGMPNDLERAKEKF
jgi:hypothetical protein